MSNERAKILEMLENGRLTAREAEQLLDALGSEGAPEKEPAPSAAPAAIGPSAGKKLRVLVNGDTEKDKNINVNVAVPLALARLVDNVLENCIPNEALDELKKQGIDLKALKLSEMIGTLETLNEDIVNADIDSDEARMKVRVYVE